jgi:hypothetical protein
MTGYEIKEEKIQTGYVDQDGKFHAVDEAEAQTVQFVQTGEDAAE